MRCELDHEEVRIVSMLSKRVDRFSPQNQVREEHVQDGDEDEDEDENENEDDTRTRGSDRPDNTAVSRWSKGDTQIADAGVRAPGGPG